MNKLEKAIEKLKSKGNYHYCPFEIKEVSEISSENQTKSFCKDGCSVECPMLYRNKLERRLKRESGNDN